MRRRRFLQAVAAAPAVPLAARQAGRGGAPGGGESTSLETTTADVTAEALAPAFFTADQYATLRALGKLLQPPVSGHPGALEAGAPEFLDFLIGASPPDRQKLYRDGLDALNAQARKQFKRSFSELDATQADAIVRPLLTVIPWSEDLPQDKLKHFVAQAHRDFRTATQNSREWAGAGAASGRRGRGGRSGLYWNPIDPVKG